MADRLGADVDALFRLSGSFGSAARDLDRIRATLRMQVHSVRWDGPDANLVRSECDRRWGPLLADAARRLEDAQRQLEQQARQQLDASGEGVHAAPGLADRLHAWLAGRGEDLSDRWSDFSDFTRPLVGLVKEPIALMGIAGMLVAHASTVGRYSKGWTTAIARGGNLLRYKSSPFLHAVAGSPTLAFLGKVGSSGLVTKVGKAAGVVGRILSGGDVINDLAHHRYQASAEKVVDLGASTLKGSKNPVGYLVGVNVSLWKEVGKEISHQRLEDWTTPLPNPFSGNAFREVYVKAAGETAVSLAKLAPEILL